MKLVVGLAVVFLLIVGFGAWWLASSTVPSSDYDEAIAELDAVNTQLEEARTASEAEAAALNGGIEALTVTSADLSAENSELRTDLAAATAQLEATAASVENLTAASEALEGRLDDAAEIVEALAYLELFMDPEYYADLADIGVNFTPYDELLATLGYDHTVASYVEEGRGWIHVNSAVIMVNDDELLENWTRFSEAELGSDEELVAIKEFIIRLVTLLHETVSSA